MVCDLSPLVMNSISPCLNPYSIGIWSATLCQCSDDIAMYRVLILILLEYGLRQADFKFGDIQVNVLILILLEYGLRHKNLFYIATEVLVLILILLEYGLRHIHLALLLFFMMKS